jgi:hypothetical protein
MNTATSEHSQTAQHGYRTASTGQCQLKTAAAPTPAAETANSELAAPSATERTVVGTPTGETMSVEEASGVAFDAPNVNFHVKLRWVDRNTARDVDVQTAWRRAVPIDAPDYGYDAARLYELADPYSVVLLAGGGELRTVLYADPIEIVDDHLETCPDCGLRHTSTASVDDVLTVAGGEYTFLFGDQCHWCHGPHPEIERRAKQADVL